MPLAVFPLVIRRWRPSGLVSDTYENFPQLAEYLPKEIYTARVAAMHELVRKEYPNVYPDSYMVMCTIIFVIGTVAFSIYARNLEISMWYPLLILLLPAFLAYWTTRRRNAHYIKISNFQDKLQGLLKEMTREDITRQVKWDYRQLRAYDNAAGLHLTPPLSSWSVGLVIEAIQADPAIELLHETGEVLPSYNAAAQDIVLDVGPEPYYDDLLAMREMDITDQHQLPAYEMRSAPTGTAAMTTTTTDTTTIPTQLPPAYDEQGDSHNHPRPT